MKKNKNIVVWSTHPSSPLNVEPCAREAYENVLLSLGYDEKNPPVADLLRRYYDLKGDWFVVSPVYFHTTHNNSVIAQYGSQLGLNKEKGRWYFDKISEFLKEEGIKLYYHSASLWLGQCKDMVSLTGVSPAYLQNKSIMPYLENLSRDMSWQKRITEIQMLLQSLNPPTQIKSSINGVWFWGQGKLDVDQDIIVSDDDGMRNLKDVWPKLKIQFVFDKNILNRADHIFFNKFTNDAFKVIEKVCQSYSCNWYWNNVTYRQPVRRWWQLFWRK